MSKKSFAKEFKALANIYIGVEDTSPLSDVVGSRPREIPKEVLEPYIALCHALAKHYDVSEDTFIMGARPIIRKAIPISGAVIGYADEGLSFADMIWRQRASYRYTMNGMMGVQGT